MVLQAAIVIFRTAAQVPRLSIALLSARKGFRIHNERRRYASTALPVRLQART